VASALAARDITSLLPVSRSRLRRLSRLALVSAAAGASAATTAGVNPGRASWGRCRERTIAGGPCPGPTAKGGPGDVERSGRARAESGCFGRSGVRKGEREDRTDRRADGLLG
jgi:hypothetical protein